MSNLANMRAIKTFILIENLLCIYRNYTFYDEKNRKLVLLHVITQLCISVVFTVNDMYIINIYFQQNLSSLCVFIISFLLFTCHTMMCIIHGISQSHSFEQLINTLEKMHKNFEDDVAYTKCIKKMNFKCFLAVAYFVLVTVIIVYERVKFVFLDGLFYFEILQLLNKVVTNYRYVVEYLVYSLYLSIINEIFKRFNGLLNEVYNRLDERIDGEIIDEIDLEMIEDWAGMYMNLVKSSKAFRKCFGVQMIVAIAMFTFRYILISYHFLVTLLRNCNGMEYCVTVLTNLIFELIYQSSIVVIAMVTAQGAQYEILHLRRTLARLYNVLTVYPKRPELRKIRNFTRLVAKNPVEINSMPKFGMGLAVLPVILSISVSHIIVMLQFNKIV